MIFEPKFLTALLFIILSFSTIFTVKTHTNTITTLIITHLVLILFLGLTITNYNSFKELVLTLILYLMAVLFLITNYHNSQKPQTTYVKLARTKLIIPALIALSAFFIIFSITKISYNALDLQRQLRLEQQIHEETPAQVFDAQTLKRNRMKKKLNDNFLLKRSSDVLLLIVAVSSAVLLLRSNNRAMN